MKKDLFKIGDVAKLFNISVSTLRYYEKLGLVIPEEVDKDTSIPTRIREILKARGITDPNAGLSEDDPRRRRTVANIILEGSRDVMRQLAFGNQEVNFKRGSDNSQVTRCPGIEKWAQDMYHFMADKYGEDNIAAFVVHLDETLPHIHCTLLPITEKNKFGRGKCQVRTGTW